MDRVLILYGTTDGQTAKIAEALATTMREEGAVVAAIEASVAGTVSPADYDAVIVAASIHAGGFQKVVGRWLDANAWALVHKPTAFVAVCLAVLENKPSVDAEIERIVQRFVGMHGWKPGQVKAVAGAVRYTRYNWIKKLVMRRIVRKAGGGTDIRRDYEYTDWNDLRDFARHFVAAYGATAGAALDQPMGAS
jgi:menaquinone-dependent protoporphyrinogen oxidase